MTKDCIRQQHLKHFLLIQHSYVNAPIPAEGLSILCRRSKDGTSCTSNKERQLDSSSLKSTQQRMSGQDVSATEYAPIQQRARIAPLVLPSSRSKHVAGELGPFMTTAAVMGHNADGSGSLHFTPRKSLNGKEDGESSPTGPLEFPPSPSSETSLGSPKDATLPEVKLVRVRSLRSPSPSRGAFQRAPMPTSSTPAVEGPVQDGDAAFRPRMKAWEASNRPATSTGPRRQQKQNAQIEVVHPVRHAGASGRVDVDKAPPGKFGGAQQFVRGAGAASRRGAAGDQGPKVPGGKAPEAVRQPTPFRRGLNAIKGRLFSDARRDPLQKVEAAARKEVHKTQQALAAHHNVKPAATPGLKGSLVQRLTRALQRPVPERPLLGLAPPPPAHKEPSQAPETSASGGGLLAPPQQLVLSALPDRSARGPQTVEERVPKDRETRAALGASDREDAARYAEKDEGAGRGAMAADRSREARRAQGVATVGGQPGGGVAEERSLETEVGVMEESEEEEVSEEEGEEAAKDAEGQALAAKQGRGEEATAESELDSDSDSDAESNCADPLAPPLLPSAAPVLRYASWAQRAPRSVSPAQSWDSQSSTEFANSRRSLLAERLLSSESGGSSRHDSPLGTTRSTAASSTYQRTGRQDNGEPPQATPAPPVASSLTSLAQPSPPPPPALAPRFPAEAVERRLQRSSSTFSGGAFSSDSEDEEDRTCRRLEMAAALRQLRAFQAGGATPRHPQAKMMRSMTEPAPSQVALRAGSPMRTLWQQAGATASLEGPGSGVKRLGMAAASRLMGRSRESSPIRPGLLASPRPLRPEASPQRVPPPPGLSSLMKSSSSVTPASGASSRASKTPSRARPIAAAAAFFRSFTPGRQRPQVV